MLHVQQFFSGGMQEGGGLDGIRLEVRFIAVPFSAEKGGAGLTAPSVFRWFLFP